MKNAARERPCRRVSRHRCGPQEERNQKMGTKLRGGPLTQGESRCPPRGMKEKAPSPPTRPSLRAWGKKAQRENSSQRKARWGAGPNGCRKRGKPIRLTRQPFCGTRGKLTNGNPPRGILGKRQIKEAARTNLRAGGVERTKAQTRTLAQRKQARRPGGQEGKRTEKKNL